MHISDLNPTEQERPDSQSGAKENCPVPFVLEAIDKPAKELESSDLEKSVKDGFYSVNLKAQSEIMLSSSCSVTRDENKGKSSASLEIENDHRSSSTDLIKVTPLETSPEMSHKQHSSTALSDCSLNESTKLASKEHNASPIIPAVSSELIVREREHQAVAASPIFAVHESIDLAQHSSVSSTTDIKSSESVEHAVMEHDSSTCVRHVFSGSASVDQITVKQKTTESVEPYGDGKTSASSLSTSDKGHGLTNSSTVVGVSESIEHSPAERGMAAPVGHEPAEEGNRMLADIAGDNGTQELSSTCTLSKIPKESINDMECTPNQSHNVLPPDTTIVLDKNIHFNQQVDVQAHKLHVEDVCEAPVVSQVEASKKHLNAGYVESDMLRKVDGIVLSLPTESEPLSMPPEGTEIKQLKATRGEEDKAIEALSAHAYDNAKDVKETGTAQSSNANQEGSLNSTSGDSKTSLAHSSGNEMPASGEDHSTAKAIEGSDLGLKSPSDVGFSSATVLQEDSPVRRDASCSSPLRETKQKAENSDSTETKPKVEDSGKLSSAEIKQDS